MDGEKVRGDANAGDAQKARERERELQRAPQSEARASKEPSPSSRPARALSETTSVTEAKGRSALLTAGPISNEGRPRRNKKASAAVLRHDQLAYSKLDTRLRRRHPNG